MHRSIAVILFMMITSVCAQQEIKELSRESFSVNDSINDSIEKLNSFRLRFHTFRQKFFSDELSINQPILPYSTWMLKSGFSADNFAPLLQQSDMVRSYKMLYGVDDDLKYLQMFLGMAQTATVGVLAYKHIKKYGFLSK